MGLTQEYNRQAKRTYVALDIEATGINPNKNRIIEIGAIKVEDGKVVDEFSTLVNPCVPISNRITELTGITSNMLKDAPNTVTAIEKFLEFSNDYNLLGHNVNYDYGYLKSEIYFNNIMVKYNQKYVKMGLDTLMISRKIIPNIESKSLKSLCEYYGIINSNEHRALSDAKAASDIYNKMYDEFSKDYQDLFAPINLSFKIKEQQPATSRQKLYLKDLIKYHKIDIGVRVDELTKSEASRLADKIILQYGKIYH